MATVYNIKIKTVSPFIAYTEKNMEEILNKLIKDYRDPKTGMKFESTEIKVERS